MCHHVELVSTGVYNNTASLCDDERACSDVPAVKVVHLVGFEAAKGYVAEGKSAGTSHTDAVGETDC